MKYLREVVKAVNKDSFKPQSDGEKEFASLHKIEKIADRNGNGDDVFNATNVTTFVRRAKRMGNDATKQDGNVHKASALQTGVKMVATESVEQVDELKKSTLKSYIKKARKDAVDHGSTDKAASRFAGYKLAKGKADNKTYSSVEDGEVVRKKPKVVASESIETVDEISKGKLKAYSKAAYKDFDKRQAESLASNDTKQIKANNSKNDQRLDGTALAHKKRLGYAKVSATESVDQVDEISTRLATNYRYKANKDADMHHDDVEHFTKNGQDDDAADSKRRLEKRENGIELARKKTKGSMDVKVPTKEELISSVLSKPLLGEPIKETSAPASSLEVGTDSLISTYKSGTPGENGSTETVVKPVVTQPAAKKKSISELTEMLSKGNV